VDFCVAAAEREVLDERRLLESSRPILHRREIRAGPHPEPSEGAGGHPSAERDTVEAAQRLRGRKTGV